MNRRQKILIIAATAALVTALGAILLGGSAFAASGRQSGAPNGGPGGVWGGCGGHGGAGGMMGSGGGMMGGAGGGWNGDSPQGGPISLDDAVKAAQQYVSAYGNDDLVLDEAMEFTNNVYVAVHEKSTGTGAFEVLVDRYTKAVFPEMGPNMMWNTRYGHMGGRGGFGGMMGGHGGMMDGSYQTVDPSQPLTVSADEAVKKAQAYLDQQAPGYKAGKAEAYYGYYTLDTSKDGKTAGMLSVNGYTGAVWYHTWHGDFLQEKELR